MANGKNIKAFIFDVGGVLVDHDIDLLAAKMSNGSPATAGKLNKLRSARSRLDVECGRCSGEEYFSQYIRPILPDWKYGDFVQALMSVFTLNEDGMDLFRTVRASRCPAYLLSNIAPFSAEAVARRFPSLFSSGNGAFLSFRMGCVKPDPVVYRKTCRAIGVDPEECIFLDDTPECVKGALKAGMEAMLFSRPTLEAVRNRVREVIGDDV